MSSQYVQRKRRIHFDQRGCYFKYMGHEIRLPKNMLEKKTLLKKLITDWSKIPDFRKQMKHQQVDKKNSSQFDDEGRGDIAMINFKRHNKQFLQKLQQELEGKTMPQIVAKIRALKEIEKKNRDAPVQLINEFYAQHDNNPTQDEIIDFLNRKKGSKEFQLNKNQIEDVEEEFVLRFKKQRDMEQIEEENFEESGEIFENLDVSQQPSSFQQQAKPKKKSPFRKSSDDESLSKFTDILEQVHQNMMSGKKPEEEDKEEESKSQKSKKTLFRQIDKEETDSQATIKPKQKNDPLVYEIPNADQIKEDEDLALEYGQYIRNEIYNMRKLIYDDPNFGSNQKTNQKKIGLYPFLQGLQQNLNEKKKKEQKNVDYHISLPPFKFQKKTLQGSVYREIAYWNWKYLEKNKDEYIQYYQKKDIPSTQYESQLRKAEALYEKVNSIYKQPEFGFKYVGGKGRGNPKNDGQSGLFLMKTMNDILSKNKYKSHKDDFLGIFQQHDSRLENKLKNLPKDQKIVFWIQNTNDFDQKEDTSDDYHWYACFLDLHHMNFNIFDSSGIVDDEQMSQVKKYIKILSPEYMLKVKRNYNDIQGYSSNCGFYAMLFLIRMMNSDGNFKYSSMRDLSKMQGRKVIDKVFTTL